MIYSIWRPHLKIYEYYEAPPRASDIDTPNPSQLGRAKSQIGATPEEASWPLPGDARRIGAGPVPRGMIARDVQLGALAGFEERLTSPLGIALLGLGAFLLYRAWRG